MITALPHTTAAAPPLLNGGLLMWVGFTYFVSTISDSTDNDGIRRHVVWDDLITHTVYDTEGRLHVVYDDLITHTVRSN